MLAGGMAIAALLIYLSVMLIAAHVGRRRRGRIDHHTGMRFILWAGAIGPTILLLVLLLTALPMMRPIEAGARDLAIDVSGEQYWWRVRYRPPGGPAVDAANEIRLPAGRPVLFNLSSPDVLHSFWIPGLAGKMDMIPGRTNRLVIRATRPGRYRGACAEFCGRSHALMRFTVVVMEAQAFDRWLVKQAAPSPAALAQSDARALFRDYGCAGCHAIQPDAIGRRSIGPDLGHVGGRGSIAAGVLPNEEAAIAGFIRHPERTKPGIAMPSFDFMPEADARAIAAWLRSLE
ncbi:cytochrome B [Sphingomonas oleivorans]|uniref:Cytochrome B n=1 Tax=Sphingomonas oleivorans TaxID=1735121 RepID=A0A2T5FTM4_9SPHN|nr:c-type cytochrome [Sphingomonas oleivorans]PTQ07414.1 cytochrome B [Sphingomonas oleivorans]